MEWIELMSTSRKNLEYLLKDSLLESKLDYAPRAYHEKECPAGWERRRNWRGREDRRRRERGAQA